LKRYPHRYRAGKIGCKCASNKVLAVAKSSLTLEEEVRKEKSVTLLLKIKDHMSHSKTIKSFGA